MPGEERKYRRWLSSDLRSFQVRVGESDLLISAERPLCSEAERALRLVRAQLESYLQRDPEFAGALRPREALPEAPAIVVEMTSAGRACGVGPMAAVAGAVAQEVGRALLSETEQVLVENGGDIFVHTGVPRTAAIFAGASPLSGRLGLRLSRVNHSFGLCTSSGTVGPSLSYGRADAAVIVAVSAVLADAAATSVANRIRAPSEVSAALEYAGTIPGVLGALAIIGEHLGAWGEIELVEIDRTADAEEEAR